MISKYNKGVVFKLDESDKQLYLILSNVKKDNVQYILVLPVDDVKKIVIDYTKSFLMKVDENDNLTVEDDRELVSYVVRETIKEEKLRAKNMK